MRFLIVSENSLYSHHIASLFREDGHFADIHEQCLMPVLGISAYLKDYPVSGLILDLRSVSLETACRLYVEWKKICEDKACILPVVQSSQHSVGLLNSGADCAHEYCINARLVLARVYALVRRRQNIYSDIFRLNSLEIDLVSKRACYKGRDLRLTPFEYRIMEVLLRNRDRIVCRDEFLLNLFPEAPDNEKTRSLEVILGRLRNKLRQCTDMRNGGVEVIRSIGYRFSISSEISAQNKIEQHRRGHMCIIDRRMAIRAGWRWFC
ncbi:hypothetical protein HMPREF9694_05556 [Klebsiella michiganensis]|nr:hypothetical protein HMPREF9694_05556 [Klebsiella michiganensis]